MTASPEQPLDDRLPAVTEAPLADGPTGDGSSWLAGLPWREAVMLIYATIALTVVHYHGRFSFLGDRQQLFGWMGLSFLMLFAGPVLLILLVFRQRLADFGLVVGEAKLWGKYLLVFLAVMIPAAAIASRLPEFHYFYPRYTFARGDHWLLLPSMGGWAVYFLAWEFFFRGFLLFGLGRRLGSIAIFIQMVPFTMAHFPKPEIESFAAIIAGLALGLMAWRGKSFVGPWLLHWLAATSMDLFVVLWPLR